METQKRILIVEDEKDIREALRDMLQDKNYSVNEAGNGQEGISIALTKHPDLVLLDLLMPEMDGMTTLKHLREDSWGKDVPVMILTNLNAGSAQMTKDLVDHKPIDYLIKSDWRIQDVTQKIENFLQSQK